MTETHECPEKDCGAPMKMLERAPSGTMSLWRCVKCGKHVIVANGQEFT